MLGEDHSLLNDFPEHTQRIHALIQQDEQFREMAKQYHALDAEIRELELSSSPIGDAAMHSLKHDRAVLKDQLYQRLVKSG